MASIVATLLPIMTSSVSAQGTPWAVKMFEETSHDFGVVARGADVRYSFRLQNIYQEDVHIARVSSSCGCTSTQVTKPVLKMYEKGEIVAVVDTRSFSRQKASKLTVEIDKPYPATVELNVHVYIRTDVVVEPGQVEFGTIAEGQAATRPLKITYAGRQNWQITRIETVSPHILVTAREVTRAPSTSPGVYHVAYDVQATLKADAPEGYIKEPITFITNDPSPNATHVVVPVQGLVVPSVSLHPSPVLLGQLRPGQSVTRNLVVRAGTPFAVKRVTCDGAIDPRFDFAHASGPKSIQLIAVTFTADRDIGRVSQNIRIETDLPKDPILYVTATGHIVTEDPTSLAVPSSGAPSPSAAPTVPAGTRMNDSGWQPVIPQGF